MRYLISIKYDGSKFYGFQRLNEDPTIQKKLEEALTTINKLPVEKEQEEPIEEYMPLMRKRVSI